MHFFSSFTESENRLNYRQGVESPPQQSEASPDKTSGVFSLKPDTEEVQFQFKGYLNKISFFPKRESYTSTYDFSVTRLSNGQLNVQAHHPFSFEEIASKKVEAAKTDAQLADENAVEAQATLDLAQARSDALSSLNTDVIDEEALLAIERPEKDDVVSEAAGSTILQEVPFNVQGWKRFESTVPAGKAMRISIDGQIKTNFVLESNVNSRGWNPQIQQNLGEANRIGYYVERVRGTNGMDTIRIDTPYSASIEKIS